MNSRFHTLTVVDRTSKEVKANLFQLLHIPCSYTPMDMFEITADLYNLYITVFEIQRNRKVDDMNLHDSSRTVIVNNVTMST